MTYSATIRGDKGHLKLTVLKYENPNTKNVDDANWLDVRLESEAGPFRGSFKLALTAIELELLYQQLARATELLSVDFTSMEGNFSLSIEFSRTGTAVLQGVVTPEESEGNALHYRFNSDPVTLEATLRELQQLVAHFPAKQSI